MDRQPVAAGYRAVLSLPELRQGFAGSCAARLSFAVLPLAMILLIRHSAGSFAFAGLASGAFSLTATVLAPARARLLDRIGQRRALGRLGVCYVAAMVALLLAAELGGGAYLLIGLAACSGASAPPLGPAMRVLWGHTLRHRQELLQTAYALDSATEELLFTTGPLLAGGLIALASPSAAMIAVIGLVAGGTLIFVSAPVTRGGTEEASRQPGQRPLGLAGMRTVIISLAGVGAAVGMLEIALPAFAEHEGSPAAGGGVMLALLSAGSAVGGLCYGRLPWRLEVSKRFVVLFGLFSMALLPLAFARSLPQVGLVVTVAGLAVAPLFTSAYLLVDRLVTRLSLAPTEANTWVSTANNGGAALGSAAAGLIVGAAGLPMTFACACLAVGGIALLTAARRSTLIPTEG